MFKLQHKYQDSGWIPLDKEEYKYEHVAVGRAAQLSEDAICYGMVRVIHNGEVIKTFQAGGGRMSKSEKEDTLQHLPKAKPPKNPHYFRAEQMTLQEGLVKLEMPFPVSKESVGEFKYWINGILRRLKRSADLIDEEDV